MKWLLNISTHGKLFLGFGVMVVFVGSVIATGYVAIAGLQASQHALYRKDFANLHDLENLRALQNQVRTEMLEAQLVSTQAKREHLLKDQAEHSKLSGQAITALLERANDDPKMLSRLKELDSLQKAFNQTKDTEVIPLILAGKIKEARQIAAGVQQGRHEKIRDLTEELSRASDESARRAVEESGLAAQRPLPQFPMAGALAILLAVTMALLIGRIIAAPLRFRMRQRLPASWWRGSGPRSR